MRQLLLVAVWGWVACPVMGQTKFPVTFQLDPDRSSLVIDAAIAGVPLEPQGADANETSYRGVIYAKIAFDPNDPNHPPISLTYTGDPFVQSPLAGPQLLFPNWAVIRPRQIHANNGGDYQPLPGGCPGMEGAPANYGMWIEIPLLGWVYGAVRDFTMELSSEATDVVDGEFDSTMGCFTFTGGDLDYYGVLLGSTECGTESLAGEGDHNQAQDASTLVATPLPTPVGARPRYQLELTIPVSYYYVDTIEPEIPIELWLVGQLVAVGEVKLGPEFVQPQADLLLSCDRDPPVFSCALGTGLMPLMLIAAGLIRLKRGLR